MVSPSAFFFPPPQRLFLLSSLGQAFFHFAAHRAGLPKQGTEIFRTLFFVYTKPAICSAARTP